MLLVCIVVGIYFGFVEKKDKSGGADGAEDDYLVGGRKMPTIPVAMSLVARWNAYKVNYTYGPVVKILHFFIKLHLWNNITWIAHRNLFFWNTISLYIGWCFVIGPFHEHLLFARFSWIEYNIDVPGWTTVFYCMYVWCEMYSECYSFLLIVFGLAIWSSAEDVWCYNVYHYECEWIAKSHSWNQHC